MGRAVLVALACAILAEGTSAFVSVPATSKTASRVKPTQYKPDTQEGTNNGFSQGYNPGQQGYKPMGTTGQQPGYAPGQGYNPMGTSGQPGYTPGAGPTAPPPSYDPMSTSAAARSLKAEMDAEMAKDKKDYQRLQQLKAQVDAQAGLDAERMKIMAEIKAAEGREDYDRCAGLQAQLEQLPESAVAADGGMTTPLYNNGYNNGMSRARRTRGLPAYATPTYGYGMPLGHGYSMGPYARYAHAFGSTNPYTGYNWRNPYNYGTYGGGYYGVNRWYDPMFHSFYGVGGPWGGIPWRSGSYGVGGSYGYGYPW